MFLPVDTAIQVTIGPLIDDTTFKDLESSVAFDAAGMSVDLIKKGINASSKTDLTLTAGDTQDWVTLGNGMYSLEITAAQNNTEGTLQAIGVATGILPFASPLYTVIPIKVYNSMVLGTDNLEVDLLQMGGSAQSATDLKDFADDGYDPTTNKVTGVVLTDLVTANTDMRGTDSALTDKAGFSLAATGLDAIASTATGAVALAKAVWDLVLTGATHNIVNSAARILRFLRSAGTYTDGLVWLDLTNGFTGTDDFENGTEVRPAKTLAEALTLLGSASMGLHGVHIAEDTSITFTSSRTSEEWTGVGWVLALGGQSIDRSSIMEATVSGVSTGVPKEVRNCFLKVCTWGGGDFIDCAFAGNQTLTGSLYHFFNTHHALDVAPIIDYGATVGATVVHMHHYHGSVQINNMGQVAGADVLHFSSPGGVLTLDATCVGGTANLSGTFKLINNSSGMTINLNGAVIQVLGVPVSSVSADNAAIKAETALIVADTGTDGVVLADDAITAAKIATDAFGSLEFATSAVEEIRDAILADSTAFNGADIAAIKAITEALKVKKNTALANFPFLLVDSTDHVTPKTGRTVTATRSIDGAGFAAAANAVTEIANGAYKISLAASDLNGDTIILRFTATDADDRFIIIATQP